MAPEFALEDGVGLDPHVALVKAFGLNLQSVLEVVHDSFVVPDDDSWIFELDADEPELMV